MTKTYTFTGTTTPNFHGEHVPVVVGTVPKSWQFQYGWAGYSFFLTTREMVALDRDPDSHPDLVVPCAPEAGFCSHPDVHTSMSCYCRYVELEYEGPGSAPIMTHAEWQR